MERVLSVEEKVRRAEEIYLRRKGLSELQNKTQKVPKNDTKKDVKLLKKMIMQIIICVCIYMIVYVVQNSENFFSQDFIQKARDILSYDTNFGELYGIVKSEIITFQQNLQGDNQNSEQQLGEAIGGAEEEIEEQNQEQNQEQLQLTQEEQDIQSIKNMTTFIKPVEGTISSPYGYRETATGRVPKNHTGTDIAANLGTKICASTEGEVVLVSEEGDYGKHLKIQIGEISIIYAHCNNIYVKQGDYVMQGQEIAEVGSTGNSTGPHLHFEIRYQERTVNAQAILNL